MPPISRGTSPSIPSGVARLELPAALAASYQASGNADIFAIRRGVDAIVAASPPSFGEVTAKWPLGTDDPSYFRLKDLDGERRDYYGLTIVKDSAAGPVSISVAHAADANFLVESLLREFVIDIGWIIPLLVTLTLVVGVVAIQSAFKPIEEISKMAAGDRARRHVDPASREESAIRDHAARRRRQSRARSARAGVRRPAAVHRKCGSRASHAPGYHHGGARCCRRERRDRKDQDRCREDESPRGSASARGEARRGRARRVRACRSERGRRRRRRQHGAVVGRAEEVDRLPGRRRRRSR